MKKILLSILVTLGLNSIGIAQQDEKGNFFTDNMEYQLKANFSLGGSTPIGIPREIREIKTNYLY